MQHSPIVIIDFGSQYTQLIARRLRELDILSIIYFPDLSENKFDTLNARGVILSGGPATVTQLKTPRIPAWLKAKDIPVLGICYGMQAMAVELGGVVEISAKREFGHAQLSYQNTNLMLRGLESDLIDVWMSHGDKVTTLPKDFQAICSTKNAPFAGMANNDLRWYGLQFHPEVTHTKFGMKILQNFCIEICKCSQSWTSGNIISDKLAEIVAQTQGEEILLGLSGGVDSSVVAALLNKAVGNKLHCVFVDTGLLRLNEVEQVKNMFKDRVNLINVNAQEIFLERLTGISCPEQKRKIIGKTFIDIFETQAKKLPAVKWLAQGTIYPDIIESSKDNIHSQVIKSHHNVGGLPEKLNLKLLEPIKNLFKDEVRKIGIKLELPAEMINRHPFPGPGLGVRILGAIQKEYVLILKQADAIFLEELYAENLYDKISQAFAVFLPVKSVGVMGDGREYSFVICLRAVETTDFMTAKWSHLPYEFLNKVSTRIINEVSGISRVTYDISSKPPATIEWE